MTCGQRQDLILAYAAGALEPAEAAELRAHLATGCSQCAGALAEAESLLAELPAALEPVTPPESIWANIESRLNEAPQEKSMKIAPASSKRSGWRLVWTSLVSAAASAAIVFFATRPVPTPVQNLIASPTTQIVRFASTADPDRVGGRIVWDEAGRASYIYIFDLVPVGPDKTYQLWFITDQGEKLSAGLFQTGPDRKASLTVPIPENAGTIVAAAVTDEPTGGSPQPTGTIVLLGQIDRN